MYAIVEIAGHQFKVEKDQKVFVNRLAIEEGKTVSFDNVLLLSEDDNITLGAPAINGAQVGAKVLRHLKGDKVIVFKKKRRKGYRVKNGHRQALSEILIESISASGKKKTKKSEVETTEEKPQVTALKDTPKAKGESVAKKTTKAVAAKKPASKAKKDDLKKIEGIGPKAAEALNAAGVDTFAKLAEKSPEDISNILTSASSRLSHLVTNTWPKQAALASEGKWDELKTLQDRLDGGVEK